MTPRRRSVRPLAGLRGFDLMMRVRELPPAQGGRTPAIAITAHPSFDSRRDAERAGFRAVFSKPFARDELMETIQRLARD